MWKYEKMTQYPINIKKKDLNMAKYLVTQYGGANGELAAAWRYLNQRYTMPDNKVEKCQKPCRFYISARF